MTQVPDHSQPTRLQHDRQHEIYLLALRNGSVEVAELAQRFDVATETIRRDLAELQSKDQLRRVHGGAVPLERMHFEPLVAARARYNADEKLRIAQAATDEIPASGAIIIDSGSTLARFAEVFPTDRDVHVITNSLTTAVTLTGRGVTPVTVLAGEVKPTTLAMVDAFTVEMVRSLSVDVVFISCDGLSFHRGLTTPGRDESTVKEAMIQAAQRVVVLADYSKIGNSQLISFADFTDIDVLITDDRADPDTIDGLRSRVSDVRIV